MQNHKKTSRISRSQDEKEKTRCYSGEQHVGTDTLNNTNYIIFKQQLSITYKITRTINSMFSLEKSH